MGLKSCTCVEHWPLGGRSSTSNSLFKGESRLAVPSGLFDRFSTNSLNSHWCTYFIISYFLTIFRRDVEAVSCTHVCVWTLDRLASVELRALPQSPGHSLPDVPVLLSLYTPEAGRLYMCLDRLHRSKLASVPRPLLRQSESKRT